MSPFVSGPSTIDRDTVLDVLVNVVPIGILAFFVGLYLVFNPWGYDPGVVLLSHFLTIFPLILLSILTYVSARVIARDEKRDTERAAESGDERESPEATDGTTDR